MLVWIIQVISLHDQVGYMFYWYDRDLFYEMKI